MACVALLLCAPVAAEPNTGAGWAPAVTTPTTKRLKANPAQPQAAQQPPSPSGDTVARPPPAAADQPHGQGIMFSDWHLTCAPAGDKQMCALSQTVRDAHNRRIIQLTARRAGAAAYLELIVPVGIAIAYGVALNLADEIVLPAQLVDCNTTGCRAVLGLDAQTLQRLKAAKALAVMVQDSKSGKVITIGGSPKGFEAGIAMLLAAP